MTAVRTSLLACLGSSCHLTKQDEKEQEVLLQSVICVYCLNPFGLTGWVGAVMWFWYAAEPFLAPQRWHAVTSRAC